MDDQTARPGETSLPYGTGHDHAHCRDGALDHASRVADEAGRPLEGLRREVLQELLRSHAPRGAYELRDALVDGDRRLQPVQIYRALESLTRLRLVHRVESRNAYIACTGGAACHTPQLLLCEGCDVVAELTDDDIGAVIDVVAARTGFAVSHTLVEITGFCPDCRVNGRASLEGGA